MKPIIEAQQVSKRYRIGSEQERYLSLRDEIMKKISLAHRRAEAAKQDFWALKEVSFEVHEGEALGLIGSNGAGKSTLLKILSRITPPTEGRITIRGRVASLLEVGTGFHPELTGRENIYLNGAILGMTRREIARKFDDIVAFSEVEKFLDTPVKRYSSGMYVRLAFGVAAHLDPEILLIDEVLAVGDARFQKKCLGKMGEVTRGGRTVLFVSHNLLALRSLCSSAVWLDGGEARMQGPTDDVVSAYIGSGAACCTEQTWDCSDGAPGNEVVRLQRVWVRGDPAGSNGSLPRESGATIGVEYWNLTGATLHTTLHVISEQQVVAFTTGSVHDVRWPETCRTRGLMRSTCHIPASFLNTGVYRVKLLIVQDRSRVILTLDDAVSFEVIESERRDGGYLGTEPGVVRPRLPWTTELVQEGAAAHA